jgi:hypothetical protein
MMKKWIVDSSAAGRLDQRMTWKLGTEYIDLLEFEKESRYYRDKPCSFRLPQPHHHY